MSTSLNNPKFLSSNEAPTAQGFTPTNQLIDDTDFPHSGLFKVLNLAIAGNYATAGFNATAVSNTSITVAEGTVFRNGELISVDYGQNASTQTLTIPTTANRYHLLVNATGATNLTIRQATADNQIPNFTAGDVVIAVLKGGTTPMQIQYLTFNQESKQLSLGGSNNGVYTESFSITGDTANATMKLESTGSLIIRKQNDEPAFMLQDNGKLRIGTNIATNTVAYDLELTAPTSASGNTPTFELENNNNSTSQAARIQYVRQSSSLGNDSKLGDIIFIARDSGNGSYEYTRIEAQIADETASAGDGRLIFFAQKAGSEEEFIRIDGNDGVVINEGSADIDFRVESNGNANMLVIDASTDRVGIGTNTPAETLDVVGTVKASVAIKAGATIHSPRLETVSSNNASLTLSAGTHAGKYLMYSGSSGTITLPATSTTGEHYTILNLTGGNITIAHGGNNINGANSNITVGSYNGVTCISEANNDWIALGV